MQLDLNDRIACEPIKVPTRVTAVARPRIGSQPADGQLERIGRSSTGTEQKAANASTGARLGGIDPKLWARTRWVAHAAALAHADLMCRRIRGAVHCGLGGHEASQCQVWLRASRMSRGDRSSEGRVERACRLCRPGGGGGDTIDRRRDRCSQATPSTAHTYR